ncbi:hypothetical protein GCM10009753_44610 [Streptantibioticus ferralitis]
MVSRLKGERLVDAAGGAHDRHDLLAALDRAGEHAALQHHVRGEGLAEGRGRLLLEGAGPARCAVDLLGPRGAGQKQGGEEAVHLEGCDVCGALARQREAARADGSAITVSRCSQELANHPHRRAEQA